MDIMPHIYIFKRHNMHTHTHAHTNTRIPGVAWVISVTIGLGSLIKRPKML